MNKLPWFTFPAIEFLGTIISKDKDVFEWGSGGSTLYYAQKAKSVTTVEHAPGWAADVAKELKKAGLTNCDLRLVPFTPGPDPEFGSEFPGFTNVCFKNYVLAIEETTILFDLISVDGRSRVACIKRAIPNIKSGGWLILDNSERDRYKKVYPLLEGWKKHEFSGQAAGCTFTSLTTIWQKP